MTKTKQYLCKIITKVQNQIKKRSSVNCHPDLNSGNQEAIFKIRVKIFLVPVNTGNNFLNSACFVKMLSVIMSATKCYISLLNRFFHTFFTMFQLDIGPLEK